MLHSYMYLMITYLEQLNNAAAPTGIKLVEFFKQANIPTSTYYRAIGGQDLRLSTATKVEDAIQTYSLHKSQSEYE